MATQSFLKARQILNAAGVNLETALANLAIKSSTNKITFSDGTIIMWGTISPTASIAANSSAAITLIFPTPFPTECEFFDALVQPAVISDFYGITSLISKSASQIQFTVRNGATAQSVAGGMWFAFGR